MVQSLKLASPASQGDPGIQRLNRLPIFAVIGLAILCLGIIIYGLSSRGFLLRQEGGAEAGSRAAASSFADQLKRGVADGIIGDPEPTPLQTPAPIVVGAPATNDSPFPSPVQAEAEPTDAQSSQQAEAEWLARLEREQHEQLLRERHRQQMARFQARSAALESPLKIDLDGLALQSTAGVNPAPGALGTQLGNTTGLDPAALQAALAAANQDQNQQSAKEDFINRRDNSPGFLANSQVPPSSPFELKRGSVIPATLMTGINADLPGRVTAQVSHNVYDTATGNHLLVPQGARLLGRYDSKVSFGQSRVLVVWTDIILPDGSTLQIGAMTGTDAEGFGGFHDRVDRHTMRTFGSAALIALIGAGMDMALPEEAGLTATTSASDAARRSFSETFGRVIEGSLSKNLNVQPTLSIRPGYQFNVLVDQDLTFLRSFGG
ncbi:conjugal transfer protein TrbI [Rhizobium sp. KAs_5_22]|uniref:IncP-type conjugal transfer protein TrbI n=1 Tax=Ciceribacter selenitireducens TaxID=448181 RepID=UPI00048BC74F|nr:IncP-type conjugal transfer protein TrbI [Ciceribacter selenitireducens]PPJ49181.1 conjugal transfer protein TrbI [Rhizobium sp. KAs_5_22]